jgi:hypothetical protein
LSTNHNFILCNADTDSIAFKKHDSKPFTDEERDALLNELNSKMDSLIKWEDDGHFRRFIVCAAKNYVLDDGKKVKIKGSGLKATKKEPALKDFIKQVIDLLLKDKKEQILFLYQKKVQEILELKDITPWCFKATVTEKVLEPTTVFNQKVLDAIGNKPVSEGDKVYLFYKKDGSLCLRENFSGDVDHSKLLGKLRDTIEVFANVFDVELFPDFSLKRNQELLGDFKPKVPVALVSKPNLLNTRPTNLLTR